MPAEGQALACSGQGPEGCQGTCFFLEREQEVICLQRHLLPRSGPCSEVATPFHTLGSPQVSHKLGRTVSCHKWPNAQLAQPWAGLFAVGLDDKAGRASAS